jgi:hypothetical protein
MTSLLLAPFRVAFGDIRFGLLGALVVTSWVTLRLAHPRVAVPLSLALIPLGLILVDRAWTEPLLMAALAIIVLSTERGHPAIGVLALALALATKQHVWLLLPLSAWWPAFGIKRAILAAALAVGMTLPFVLGAPGAFMDDAVWFLLRLPPRQDSVSLAAIALADGIDIPTVIALALVASIVVLVGIRAPRTALGFLTGVAATLAAFDLVNKQSFFNYHALVIAVTTLAIADATPWLATMDEPVLVAVSAPQASEPASSPAIAGP